MQKSILIKVLFLLVAMLMVLSACQFSLPAAATPDAVQTAAAQTIEAMTTGEVPGSTATPAVTDTPLPTATPMDTATATLPIATATSSATPTPAVVQYGPTGFPSNVNPLTGEVVANLALLARRPMMIKVANYPREGRPHAGLADADIVFDYYIGEGANRFLALYYGKNSPKVGPIRSGRYVDVQLVPMYQGILGFESAWAPILEKIFATLGTRAVYGTDNTCPAICDDGRHEVTSWFADIAKLDEYATKKGIMIDPRPNLDGMYFSSAAPQGGKPAQSLLAQFFAKNLSEWRYDAASGRYLAWIEAVDAQDNVSLIPMLDRNTNQQVSFANVVVMYATYDEMAPALHDIDIAQSYSPNKALLFRDGMILDATWKSAGLYKPIVFLGADKQPLAFKPGNTWIFIMGQASKTQETEPGKWNVQFYLP